MKGLFSQLSLKLNFSIFKELFFRGVCQVWSDLTRLIEQDKKAKILEYHILSIKRILKVIQLILHPFLPLVSTCICPSFVFVSHPPLTVSGAKKLKKCPFTFFLCASGQPTLRQFGRFKAEIESYFYVKDIFGLKWGCTGIIIRWFL